MGGEENIRVVGRFRPLNARELGLGERGNRAAPRFGPEGRTVWVGPDESTGQYALDAVLPPESTQEDLFGHAKGIVDAVMQGYNGTLLAYGQVRTSRAASAGPSRCGALAPCLRSPRLLAPSRRRARARRIR